MTVAEIERIGAPDISRMDALSAFREYRRAVVEETDRQRKREYEAITRGYKAIAKGLQVIDLHKVMQAAGLQPDTYYPKLAVCRADAERCHVHMFDNGRAVFSTEPYNWRQPAKPKCVTVPAGTFESYRAPGWDNATRPQRWSELVSALVPMIPPHLKPKRALGTYHILWDAVWTKQPPVDPLLLKHCGGALYAIVAAWDLTPLEQAVMRGRL